MTEMSTTYTKLLNQTDNFRGKTTRGLLKQQFGTTKLATESPIDAKHEESSFPTETKYKSRKFLQPSKLKLDTRKLRETKHEKLS